MLSQARTVRDSLVISSSSEFLEGSKDKITFEPGFFKYGACSPFPGTESDLNTGVLCEGESNGSAQSSCRIAWLPSVTSHALITRPPISARARALEAVVAPSCAAGSRGVASTSRPVGMPPCVLALCAGPVRWPYVLALCACPVRWPCVLALCAGPVRWPCVLALCAGPVRWLPQASAPRVTPLP